MLSNLRKSFTARLGLGITFFALPIFLIALGVLFQLSRHMIRLEAVGRATSVLNATMERISRNLLVIENATNSNTWQIEQSFTPQAIQGYSNLIVRLNPLIDGCSITARPDMFPEHGRYFSAYTIRDHDSIRSVIEEPYDYYTKAWYKTPYEQDKPCWVVYYDNADSIAVSLDGLLASYGRPLYSADSTFLGVISTDLSLLRLSQVLTEQKPYPHSYFMMVDDEGHYIVHPDSSRLYNQTIFTNANPRENTDIFALGHEMTKGRTGHFAVKLDGQHCLVCYQPVPNTNWSLAIVCPDTDVLASFHRLTYIVIPLLIIGTLVILILYGKAVSRYIQPLNALLEKTQAIAAGNLEVHIRKSQREDVIGHLQNSYVRMLRSLQFHIGSVQYTTTQAQQRNEELAEATRLAQEADKQKTTFIQNVSHQIRTPLNIILGFAQVLRDTIGEGLTEDESKSIADILNHNTKHLNRMLLMLFDSSDSGLSEELNSSEQEEVVCNDVIREAVDFTHMHYPSMPIQVKSELPDDFTIQGKRLYLMRTLRELLYNAAKYSDGQHISLIATQTPETVRFIVEDTGKGISESDRQHIFKFFDKVDDLTEGLGLGLPLAKRHAQNQGGDIMLDADYHDGCRFILELPRS